MVFKCVLGGLILDDIRDIRRCSVCIVDVALKLFAYLLTSIKHKQVLG